MEQISLANSFPPATEADWLALAEKALNGAPFAALRTELHEGVQTEPLYGTARHAAPLFQTRGWRTIQPLTADAGQFNSDLANGASAFAIDLSELPAETLSELKNILASDVCFYFTPGSSPADAAFVLAANADHPIKGSAGFDPLPAAAKSGELPADKSTFWADFADAAFYLREHQPGFVPFMASGEVWDGAGGSAVQELGFTLAAAAAYWHALTGAAMPIGDAARTIGFKLTASADVFLTVAKFRALRLLWARALGAAGEKLPQDLLLIARMSSRILSAYDPHVNILRGTAAAFGAAIGGAGGIEVLPFDGVSGGAAAFSRRIARNTSLILAQESYLPAVADAAAGSGYLEALTDALAAKSWALFRETEAQGGLSACLENGFVRDELRRTSAARERAAAYRRDKITGVSVFPNLAEIVTATARGGNAAVHPSHPYAGKLPQLPSPAKGERFSALAAAARQGSTLSQLKLASRRPGAPFGPPIPAHKRDAEPFEALRRRADFAVEKIGSRPPIFLAPIGKPDDYRARASWVQSFFAAGGIEVIVPEKSFDSSEALAEAFRESPAPAVCLCSSNAGYALLGGAAAALKKAGAVAVYLAAPASILKSLPQENNAAIDRLVFEGCNALAILQEAHGILKVQELSLAAEEEAKEGGFEANTHPHDTGHCECGC